jgi:hypothetical protein
VPAAPAASAPVALAAVPASLRRETLPPIEAQPQTRHVRPALEASGLRMATHAERERLRPQLTRELELLDGHVALLESKTPGVRTPALVLTQAQRARRRAVAAEVDSGRLFLRTGAIPLEVLEDWRSRGGEAALLDDGELRGVVFLDPKIHAAWGHLRAEAQAPDIKSPGNFGREMQPFAQGGVR